MSVYILNEYSVLDDLWRSFVFCVCILPPRYCWVFCCCYCWIIWFVFWVQYFKLLHAHECTYIDAFICFGLWGEQKTIGKVIQWANNEALIGLMGLIFIYLGTCCKQHTCLNLLIGFPFQRDQVSNVIVFNTHIFQI